MWAAAFGRLCVETIVKGTLAEALAPQPPSGGCVLKLQTTPRIRPNPKAAAFGRLCVETGQDSNGNTTANGSRLRAAVC